MLTLIIYFLCVYIIFKAVEIFQIALMSSRPDRRLGLVIGSGAIVAALAFAAYFAFEATMQAWEAQKGIEGLQKLPGMK